jgi:hypothetical protein
MRDVAWRLALTAAGLMVLMALGRGTGSRSGPHPAGQTAAQAAQTPWATHCRPVTDELLVQGTTPEVHFLEATRQGPRCELGPLDAPNAGAAGLWVAVMGPNGAEAVYLFHQLPPSGAAQERAVVDLCCKDKAPPALAWEE